MAQLVKNPPAVQETLVWFLGQEDLLENGEATHSCIFGFPWWLSWLRICLQCGGPGFNPWVGKIPWLRDWLLAPVSWPGEFHESWRREQLPTPVFWPGEFHGLYSPWSCRESGMTEWLSLSTAFIRLISFSVIPSRSIYIINGKTFPFLWLSNIILYMHITSSLSIYLSIDT